MQNIEFNKFVTSYLDKLKFCFNDEFIDSIWIKSWTKNGWINKNIFICGNGGSGANANHIANDLLYGVGLIEKLALIN